MTDALITRLDAADPEFEEAFARREEVFVQEMGNAESIYLAQRFVLQN